jgi:hypothetical protein
MYISYSTAKTYVARLYQKLGATNRTQALMIAVRYGLISAEEESPSSSPQAEAGDVSLPQAEVGDGIPAAS